MHGVGGGEERNSPQSSEKIRNGGHNKEKAEWSRSKERRKELLWKFYPKSEKAKNGEKN